MSTNLEIQQWLLPNQLKIIYIFNLFLFLTSSQSTSYSSSSSRCSCVIPSSCSTQLYGRLPKDIALLGLYSPCPTHGEVLCCDRSGLEHLYQDSQLPVIISQVTARGVDSAAQIDSAGPVTAGQAATAGPVTAGQAATAGPVTAGQADNAGPVTAGPADNARSRTESILPRCSCVVPSSCSSQVYGRRSEDIALLGLYSPCPTYGEVLCCDRSGLEHLYRDKQLSVTDGAGTARGVERGGQYNVASQDTDSQVTANRVASDSAVTAGQYVKCGCIPRGICLDQFIRVSADQCGEQLDLEMCCIPRQHVADNDSHEIQLTAAEDSHEMQLTATEDSHEAQLTAASVDSKERQLVRSSIVKQLKEKNKISDQLTAKQVTSKSVSAAVKSASEATKSSKASVTVTSTQPPAYDRYSLPCVAATLCRQKYGLSARDIAQYGVMPACKHPAVRCVKTLGQDGGPGGTVGQHRQVPQPTVFKQSLPQVEEVIEDEQNSKTSKYLNLKDKLKLQARKSIFGKLRTSKIKRKLEDVVKKTTNTSSNSERVLKQIKQLPQSLAGSTDTEPYHTTTTTTTSPQRPSQPPLQINTQDLSNQKESESLPLRREKTIPSPPMVTIVPCTPPHSCPGTAYSPLSPQHRQQYGVLSLCSQGMVRCVYHLDLAMFLHEDNFNLPIFNVGDFISFLSESIMKNSEDQKFFHNEPKVNESDNDATEDGFEEHIITVGTGIEKMITPAVDIGGNSSLSSEVDSSEQLQEDNNSEQLTGKNTKNKYLNIKEKLKLPPRKSLFDKLRKSKMSSNSKYESIMKTSNTNRKPEVLEKDELMQLEAGSTTSEPLNTNTTNSPPSSSPLSKTSNSQEVDSDLSVQSHDYVTPTTRKETSRITNYQTLGSIFGSLRRKQILEEKSKILQNPKPVRILEQLKENLTIKKESSIHVNQTASTTPTPAGHHVVMAGGSQVDHGHHNHLPDARQITGVEIVMPTSELAMVRLHMDKDMMELRLDDEQLLPVLQSLITALDKIDHL